MLALVMVLAPADTAQAEPPPPGANAICPVDGDRARARFAIEHEGQRVYLCCGRCAGRFRQAPERYMAIAMELPRVGGPTSPAPDDHGHDSQEYDGHAHDAPDHGAPTAEADHVHDHADEGLIAAGLHWLGHFHVVTVHFPIGLLLAGAVGEAIWLMTRRGWLRHGVRFSVWAGAIGAVLTVPLGWMLAGLDLRQDDWLLATHRWLGSAAFLWAIALVILMERAGRGPRRSRWLWAYRIALFGGAVLVGVTGHFGGMIVHGTEYLRW